MHKIHLDIDALAVESFETATDATDGRGTVNGFGKLTNGGNCQPSMPCAMSDDDPTCAISCGYVNTCPNLTCGSIVLA